MLSRCLLIDDCWQDAFLLAHLAGYLPGYLAERLGLGVHLENALRLLDKFLLAG